MATIASLSVNIGADVTDFKKKVKGLRDRLSGLQKKLTATGKALTIGLTAPITALGVASVAAFDKQAKAEASLRAAIKANGKEVETTFAKYKQFATEMQAVTTVGDETTLGLIQMAEAMGSPAPLEAAKNAIGLAAALGISEESAIRMTSAASAGDFTLLNRYIPALRGVEDESEKAAIAQQFFASGMDIAKAQAQAGLGPLKQLQNQFGDLLEEFGAVIVDGIKPLIGFLRKLISGFQALSPQTKKIIVIVAGLAAAIGPLLLSLGLIIKIAPLVGAAFTLMTGPIGIIIAAIAALIALITTVIIKYNEWGAAVTLLMGPLGMIINLVMSFRRNWESLRNAFKFGGIQAGIKKIGAIILDAILMPLQQVLKLASKLPGLGKLAEKGFEGIKSIRERLGVITVDAEVVPTKTKAEQVDKIEIPVIPTFEGASTSEVLGDASSIIDGVTSSMKGMNESIKETPESLAMMGPPMDASLEKTQEFAEKVTVNLGEIATQQIQSFAASSIESIGTFIGQMAAGGQAAGGFGENVINAVAGFMKAFGSSLISAGVAALAFQQLAIAPGAAIAAGVALVAAAALVKTILSQGIGGGEAPKLAKGGLAFGPTLAMVGDNPGASINPEVIAPLNTLQGMMGGGKLEARISGDEMIFFLDRARGRQNRTAR